MVQKNIKYLFCFIALSSLGCLSASQGDELWQLVENGSLVELQSWVDNPFNNPDTATDDEGFTLLHMSARKGRFDFAKYLISKDFPVDACSDQEEMTPLHEAVLARSLDIVPLLVSAGADINAQDQEGSTPLHLAAVNDCKKTVELLIASDSDLEIEDNAGRKPIELVSKSYVAATLFNRGALPLMAQALDEPWREPGEREMLEKESQRCYDRLFLVKKLLSSNGLYSVLQDLVAIDMLVPAERVKEVKDRIELLSNKRVRESEDDLAEEREALGAKKQRK